MAEFTFSVSGGPVVMRHKGWSDPKRRGPIAQQKPVRLHGCAPHRSQPDHVSHSDVHQGVDAKGSDLRQGQRFEFVNATTTSPAQDAAAREKIRAHVMRRRQRNDKVQSVMKGQIARSSTPLDFEKQAGTSPADAIARCGSFSGEHSPEDEEMVSIAPQPMLKPNIRYLDAQPQLRKAIGYLTTVASAMYPMELYFHFNPLSPERWFQTALADTAQFHALLYASCVYHGLVQGITESREAALHLERASRLINDRLSGPAAEITDTTIGAVSCLAMGEAVRGHPDAWNVHMSGLRQMIQMRGGFSALHGYLRQKIYRADLVGAVDYMTEPHFAYETFEDATSYQQMIPSGLETIDRSPTYLSDAFGLEPGLSTVLEKLYRFSKAVEFALTSSAPLSPQAFVEDSYSIRHGLLSFSSSASSSAQERHIQEGLRLGALIYMKDLLREFPRSVVGMEVLIERLKKQLELVSQIQGLAPLLCWLFFIGGMYSVGTDRVWFVAHLVKIKSIMGLDDWHSARRQLEDLFWIEKIHDASGQTLWEEVEITGSILMAT